MLKDYIGSSTGDVHRVVHRMLNAIANQALRISTKQGRDGQRHMHMPNAAFWLAFSLGDTRAAAGQHLRKIHSFDVDEQAVAEVDQIRRAWQECIGAPIVDGVPVQGSRMCEAYACCCGFVTSSVTRKRLHKHNSGEAAPSWEACSAQQLAFSTSLQRVRPAAGHCSECWHSPSAAGTPSRCLSSGCSA